MLQKQRFRVGCWLRRLLGRSERALLLLMMKLQALDFVQVLILLVVHSVVGWLLDCRRQLVEGVPVLLDRAWL